MILVDDFHVRVGLHVRAGDRPRLALLDRDDAGRITVVLDDQRLDVQHDVGHVLQDARDRGELVLCTADLDLRYRTAFQARQQNAAQTVADGNAKTAFERLGHELAIGRRESLRVTIDNTRQLQPTPSNMHR